MQHEPMRALEAASRPHRWQVKDFIVSPWRELPGTYTATEIFQLRRAGRFMIAIQMSEKLTGNDSALADSTIPEGDTARIR